MLSVRVLHKLDDVGFTRQGMINMEQITEKIMNVMKDGMQKVGGMEEDC